jgi:hypothetical protein
MLNRGVVAATVRLDDPLGATSRMTIETSPARAMPGTASTTSVAAKMAFTT